MMKRLSLLIGIVAAILLGTPGCATLTHSAAERAHQAQRVTDYDVMLFNEDLDYFLLQDRPSRLSKWIIR